MTHLSFFVPGRCATAGSKRAFAIKKGGQYTGRVVMFGDNPREKDWKTSVAAWATSAMRKAKVEQPLSSPLRLEITFVLGRPKHHFRTNGELKPNAPELHTSKPDATKLLRCAEDALKSIVWRDDSQVCSTIVHKRYGPVPGAHVTICEEIDSGNSAPRSDLNQQTLTL